MAEAISLMETGRVAEGSLDHDLGLDEQGVELPEGRTLVYWMAENDCWPSEAIAVHSANVAGVDYMVGMIERYGPFERVAQTTRFTRRHATTGITTPSGKKIDYVQVKPGQIHRCSGCRQWTKMPADAKPGEVYACHHCRTGHRVPQPPEGVGST